MRRREFLGVVGGAVVAWPLATRAQQPTITTIGYLALGTLEKTRDIVAGVQRGLGDTGYVEGGNLAVEYRWAEYHMDRVPVLAADLIQRKVALIIAFALPPVEVIKAASKSIPFVCFFGADPVAAGLVASLNQPGGNITGVSVLNIELVTKRLELLHELIPTATSVAVLVGSSVSDEHGTKDLKDAASALGLQLVFAIANGPDEFEDVFAMLARKRVGALIVGSSAVLTRNSDRLADLATRYRIPAIYANRISTVAGGLLSYGTHYSDAYRIVGNYAGRVLKGEKPADLPVQQVTKIELAINLKTAKSLGIAVPPALLARADEVIE